MRAQVAGGKSIIIYILLLNEGSVCSGKVHNNLHLLPFNQWEILLSWESTCLIGYHYFNNLRIQPDPLPQVQILYKKDIIIFFYLFRDVFLKSCQWTLKSFLQKKIPVGKSFRPVIFTAFKSHHQVLRFFTTYNEFWNFFFKSHNKHFLHALKQKRSKKIFFKWVSDFNFAFVTII